MSTDPFDLDALLAPKLEGYEPRAGQANMARSVERALSERRQLIVEAGTGTGKSLAYLIPLATKAVEGEFRAVVSTYTKALQRQLTEKDLPFVRREIAPRLRFALAFGSENYLCMRRYDRLRAQKDMFLDDPRGLDELMEWAGRTRDGIREGSGQASSSSGIPVSVLR